MWKFRKLCLGNVEKLKRFRGVTDVGVEIERIPEKSPEPDIAAGKKKIVRCRYYINIVFSQAFPSLVRQRHRSY